MLRSIPFQSPFFARLYTSPRLLPLDEVEREGIKGWMLRPATIATWKDLEFVLAAASEALLNACWRNPEAKFPFDAFWPLPCQFGYDRWHKTQGSAFAAAAKARDACLVLTARLSMAMALCEHENHGLEPAWVEILRKAKCPSSWIDELRNSPIANFAPNMRAGTFLWPYENGTRWMNHVPCMIRANLPVYIRWNPINIANAPDFIASIVAQHPFLKPYTPDTSKLIIVSEPYPQDKRRFRWRTYTTLRNTEPVAYVESYAEYPAPNQQYRIELPHPSSLPWRQPQYMNASEDEQATQPSVDDIVSLPNIPIPAGIGQKEGESFQEFLDRRAKENKKAEDKESEDKKAARLRRAEAAREKTRPDKQAKVFVWKKVGDKADLPNIVPEAYYDQPYRFGPIGRGAIGEIWATVPKAHMLYDAFRHEWDINEDLAPDEFATDAEEEYMEQFDQPIIPISSAKPNHNLSDAFQNELARFYDNPGYVGFCPPIEAFKEISWFRYGIVPNVVQGANVEYNKHDIKTVMKFFGLTENETIADELVKSCSAYIASISTQRDTPHVPGVIWDLSPSSSMYLKTPNRINPHIVEMDHHTLNKRIMWNIMWANEDHNKMMLLMFEDARTVVEILRRHSICDTPSAVKFLCERGIPFHTLHDPTDHKRFTEPKRPIVDGLGWKPRNYADEVTVHDYAVYERRAHDLLNERRGRAAILRGGIVWRLAIHILGADAISRAQAGPSSDIYTHGEAFHPVKDAPYYDDALDEREYNLICGMYTTTNRKYLSKSHRLTY